MNNHIANTIRNQKLLEKRLLQEMILKKELIMFVALMYLTMDELQVLLLL
ncbi:protein of unknown function [Candidatus Nitrosocosmicus franklandus]|uniref:Uncharacterized protein n=1 Tax=Candidatus Nitrosocosmicus franklandianus TaxID=1798806 RepID=A0A484I9X9_9ARCH|nr:protein of unknown function [Candidatus Nitrosocosmicus franklandus]